MNCGGKNLLFTGTQRTGQSTTLWSTPRTTLWIVLWFIQGFLSMNEALAEIHEIKAMGEIPSRLIVPDTLLVFDIDNTLIEPVGQLGSDQWFYYLYQIYKVEGLPGVSPEKVSEGQIDEKAMQVWNDTQWLIEVRAPEGKATSDFVSSAQRRGLNVMALTARTLDVAGRTADQLKSVGIDFTAGELAAKQLRISKQALDSQDDALFTGGVLYVGESNNKGEVLVQFLKEKKLHAQRIVFVDDKVKHVKNMEIALAGLKIPYHGYRYGAVDEKVSRFNEAMSEVADKQKAELYLHGRFTDEAMKKIRDAKKARP
jgi:hypothetical protein